MELMSGIWQFFCTKKDDEFEVDVSLKKLIIIMGSDICVVADYFLK